MAINDMPIYYVGTRPNDPLAIDVRDAYGRNKNLSIYNNFEVLLIGSDNEVIDVSDAQLTTSQAATGRFVFRWPTDKSLFTKSGDYLLQLVMRAPNGAVDMTSPQTIRVKNPGGIK